MNHLSTQQLSVYLQVSKRTIQRRSINENWQYTFKKGLGGNRKVFAFSALPASVKSTVIAKIIAKHEQQGLVYCANPSSRITSSILINSTFVVANKGGSKDWLAQHIFAEAFEQPLDDAEFDKQYVKVGLLTLAMLYVKSFSLGKINGFDQFCQLYNNREFAVKKDIYGVVDKVSRITLLRWEKQLKESGAHNSMIFGDDLEATNFDCDLKTMAEELLMTSPNLSADSLKQYFATIYPERKTPSVAKLKQWLNLQQQKN